MENGPFRDPPFMEWRIDRWKFLVLGILFALLLGVALLWPEMI